jgi:hypothetical protein
LVDCRNLRQGPAGKNASHACGRDAVVDPFPDEEVFGVVFRELVDVDTGRKIGKRCLQGIDRDLNHGETGNKIVIELEGKGMNHVFGIVDHDPREFDTVFLLE